MTPLFRRAAATGLAAALAVPALLLGTSPAMAAPSETIALGADGTVAQDSTFTGPQVSLVRVLEEGKYLEIHWDRYVDELAAVDPANITLMNGDTAVQLVAKPANGSTNTIFFDRENQQIAATDASSMKHLDADTHFASIAYRGTIDMALPLTLEIDGDAIVDADGNAAKSALYTGVPEQSFYPERIVTSSGVVVKASASVKPESLANAAAQVEAQLAVTGTGVGARMAEAGCSLAVYGARENTYFVPEHRGGYSPTMYDVEGYGGNFYNNCVSSISERNVLRVRDASNEFENTNYPNENILIHEFGHAVRSVGVDGLADTALSDEFFAAYENAYLSGLWPNTYAISNSDEFFATLSAIWFNVMAEKPDWNDGVRSPINTRAELQEYDPQSYAFFAKIYPSDVTLPAPWDEPAPDVYHGDYTEVPAGVERVAASDIAYGEDAFRLTTQSVSGDFQIDRFSCDDANPQRDICLWFTWGDGVWNVDYADGAYTISASDGSGVLRAASATEAEYQGVAADSADPTQRWNFVPAPNAASSFEGLLVNASTGTALTLDGRVGTGVSLKLVDPSTATRWMLEDTNATAAQGTLAYLQPLAVTFSSTDEDAQTVYAPAQGFALPSITAVAGDDWTRDGYTFAGWALDGSDTPVDDAWAPEPGVTAVAFTALWTADSDNGGSDNGGSDNGGSDNGSTGTDNGNTGSAGESGADRDGLASTGSSFGALGAVMAALIVAGIAGVGAGVRARMRSHS